MILTKRSTVSVFVRYGRCGERLFENESLFVKSFSNATTDSVGNATKKDVSGRLPATYVPSDVEPGWYCWWEEHDFFKSSHVSPPEKLFTMILPPPNVTGHLHLGHALTASVQDAIVRWYHMHGNRVIWVPGTDHAGIATQVVVEKQLWAKQKLTRHQLGREQFLEEIIKWQETKGSHIQGQLRRLGTMLDWNREYFTLDKNQTSSVTEAFIRLFDEGLIYRKTYPVNWCCWLSSTISDIEVESREIDGPTLINVPGYEKPLEFGKITDIAYKLFEKDEEIVVSTTRPETLLGDVAVAVHPSDPRYSHLHGAQLWHPYRSEKIPLICDTSVDTEFGTGAVKITPAHSKADFDVSTKHNLEFLSVIDENGNICNIFGAFGGMKRFDAREHIINDLACRGLLRGIRDHKMVLPICSRSGDVIEFIPRPQWFLSVREMKKNAQEAVLNGNLKLLPERMNKIWHQWFDETQDWCLSRQLWWGHRVPAYKCYLASDVNKTVWIVAKNKILARSKASSALSTSDSDPMLKIEQDDDVLDTWFSSSLLPFSVFGWPSDADYKKFYPLSLMETGNDILTFWVARMVMLGQHLTQEVPFKHVFLHGVVCDASGRKMSKSVGNVVSPEDIREGRQLEDMMRQVEESHKSGAISSDEVHTAKEGLRSLFPEGIPACGTDALRFTLCSNDIQSQFIKFNIKECYSNRLFGNKIWQACRYVENLMNQSCEISFSLEHYQTFSKMDRWILSRLYTCIALIDQGFRERQIHLCTSAIKNFIYDDFCDVYLESTKVVVNGDDRNAAQTAICVLVNCCQTMLLTLAPFMPFISEEIYQRLGFLQENCHSIMQVPFPQTNLFIQWCNEALEKDIEIVLKAVSAVRRLKINNGFKHSQNIAVVIQTVSLSEIETYNRCSSELSLLGRCYVTYISQGSSQNILLFQEERATDFSTVKIVFSDDKERLVSENAIERNVLNAVRKKIKLLKEISDAQKFIHSSYFKMKASEDRKESQYIKLKNLEEELRTAETILSYKPDLTEKFQLQVKEENKRKLEQKQDRQVKHKNKNKSV